MRIVFLLASLLALSAASLTTPHAEASAKPPVATPSSLTDRLDIVSLGCTTLADPVAEPGNNTKIRAGPRETITCSATVTGDYETLRWRGRAFGVEQELLWTRDQDEGAGLEFSIVLPLDGFISLQARTRTASMLLYVFVDIDQSWGFKDGVCSGGPQQCP